MLHLLRPHPILDPLLPDLPTALVHVPAMPVLEKRIHLLQRPTSRLRVHEDHERDAEDVEPEQQEERPVANGLEEEGRDHGDDAVADGPPDDGPRAAFGAYVQREDLGGVEPGGGEPCGAERGRVEEGEGGDGGAVFFLVGPVDLGVFVEDASDEEDEGHTYGAPDHGC